MGPANLRSHVPEDVAARYRQLFNAVRSGETQTVTALLEQGMDVNLRGPRGATPLHIAARFGQNSMVDLLLSHGANVAARDDSGKSPFDKARASSTGGAIAARLVPQWPHLAPDEGGHQHAIRRNKLQERCPTVAARRT